MPSSRRITPLPSVSINRTARLPRPNQSGIIVRTDRGIVFVYAELRDEDYLYLHENRVPLL